ncbi:MAG TPA: hypothetical protein VMF91_27480 [Bryobacteraceae bacterium]|nr:hypothetical protein [Bryobacteraceae bacterium]
MNLAVEISKQSKSEEDGRCHPLVGAVVAREGFVLSTGFREEVPNAHAEESAMSKLRPGDAAGATVYTTLEPCTTRKKMPCTQLLITRRVKRVVIGMLDPNPDIRGQGEWLLESVGVSIGKFEPDLVAQIKDQNAIFIDYMLGLGITILSPVKGEIIRSNPISVSGVYRVHPRPGDNIILCTRHRSTYWPQAPISWSREGRTWRCDPVYQGAQDKPVPCGIVVARVSEDFGVWLKSYFGVHTITKEWIGAEMPMLPPGFEVLASVDIVRAA